VLDQISIVLEINHKGDGCWNKAIVIVGGNIFRVSQAGSPLHWSGSGDRACSHGYKCHGPSKCASKTNGPIRVLWPVLNGTGLRTIHSQKSNSFRKRKWICNFGVYWNHISLTDSYSKFTGAYWSTGKCCFERHLRIGVYKKILKFPDAKVLIQDLLSRKHTREESFNIMDMTAFTLYARRTKCLSFLLILNRKGNLLLKKNGEEAAH